MPAPAETLRDPSTCGENLFAIANRAIELAPVHCVDCGAYHVRIPASRAVGVRVSIESDRALIIGMVRDALANVPERRERVIKIAGSADTGLLATCAHAAAGCGEGVLERTHFSVVDLCGTPLALCSEFALLHGLHYTPIQEDILAHTPTPVADVVLMHSALRFLTPDSHVSALRHIARWLAPGGRIILSNAASERTSEHIDELRWLKDEALRRITLATGEGRIRWPDAARKLQLGLRESSDKSIGRLLGLASVDEALSAFKKAGLQPLECDVHVLPSQIPGVSPRKRLLAVLVNPS